MADQPIQAFAPGLLAQLGIVGAPRTPGTLMEGLRAVYSMEHLYAANEVTSSSQAAAGYVNGNDGPTLTVPAGQAWRIYGIAGTLYQFTGAPAAVSANLSIGAPGAAQQVTVAYRTGMTGSATAVFRFGQFVPQPFVLMPGSTITLLLDETLSAGTCSMRVSAVYQSLRV